MSGLDNLNKRLQYRGGNAEGRFINDKLRGLKKALLYSYQAETAVLADGREFRCLINPDKIKEDYDNKEISIPFKDICLNKPMVGTTSQGQEEIGMKAGDVFGWKETKTYWIVYLPYIEENAYFRAAIRRCKYEVEINGNKYKVAIQGPVETDIPWNQKSGITWNDMNYSSIMYITKNEETLNFFKRFEKIKINEKTWEIKVVDSFAAEGIIQVHLGETFNNSLEDVVQEEVPEIKVPEVGTPHILGKTFVSPYDIMEYSINNITGGAWSIDNNKKAKIIGEKDNIVTIEIVTGKSGKFNLIYSAKGIEDIIFPIVIESL